MLREFRPRIRFNPHLTGYGLEVWQTMFTAFQAVLFQSSSYWIRAGRNAILDMIEFYRNCFNPHLTGYGLEAEQFTKEELLSFNPHLTGYGLEEPAATFTAVNQPFQSSSYWIRAGSY